MPSVSTKQHNLMEGVAHDPSFAKKVGIPQSVGKDFVSADKGKFSAGGEIMSEVSPGQASAVHEEHMESHEYIPNKDGICKICGNDEVFEEHAMADGGVVDSSPGMAAPPGMAEGGEVHNEGYDYEIAVPGSADEIDQVLRKVVALTEDCDTEHEIKSTMAEIQDPVEEKPTEDRIEQVEAEPAPEAHDDLEHILDKMKRDEDAHKPRTYGLRRGGMVR